MFGRKVLIVAGNESLVQCLEFLLDQEGCKVEKAFNGLDGIRAAHRSRPEIALVDLHLPDVDAIKVCRYLKRDPLLHPLIVIVMTSDDSDDGRGAVRESGADGFLSKPVSTLNMIRFIGNYFRHHGVYSIQEDPFF